MHEPERPPVDVLLPVRVGERAGGVGADARHEDGRDGLGGRVLDQLAGVHAVDELHRDEEALLELPELVDVDDVRVREPRRVARLVEEHLDELARVGEVREDALHRDAPVEALDAALPREEHLGHAAAREPLAEHVLTKRNAGGRGHGRPRAYRSRSLQPERRRPTSPTSALLTIVCSAPRVIPCGCR